MKIIKSDKENQVDNKTQPELLIELSEALTQAIGASSQLIHTSGNPAAFLTIRQALELTKEGVLALAPTNVKQLVVV